jgi:hypothetical protein
VTLSQNLTIKYGSEFEPSKITRMIKFAELSMINNDIRSSQCPLTTTQRNFIASIKEKIRLAQYEALKEINTQLIKLYWEIGKGISERQWESWGNQ